MKILQVTPTYPPAWSYGGITKAVYKITEELCKRGHEVEVWTSDALDLHSRVKSTDISTVRAEAKIRYFKNLSFALTRLLNVHVTLGMLISSKRELNNFDVVHLHGARAFQNLMLFPYLKKHGVPYVFQAHGSLPRIYAKQRLKRIYDVFFGYRLLRDASKVIALSQMEAEQYKYMGVPEEKIEVIPNGIDPSDYNDLPPKDSFKKKFKIPEDKKVILYLGRIHKTKGIDFLVNAYAHIINDMKYDDVVLVIAGPDDGYLGKAKSIVSHLGISNRVLFTGFLTEYEKLSAFVDSCIFINMCAIEPFGIVSLEGSMCYNPVLVSQGTMMARIVNEGHFGFSIKYGDIDSLAGSIRTLIENHILAEEMGKKGRNFIMKNFSWENIVDKLERIYSNVSSDAI